MQVPETFDASSYQQAMSAVHEELQDETLPDDKLDLVLRLASELAALVKVFSLPSLLKNASGVL